MSNFIADIKIPDSKLAVEAAELLHEHGDDLLWNHSNRVFLFALCVGTLTTLNMMWNYFISARYFMI